MQSSDHSLTREELMAYLDGEVSADRVREVEGHLRGCPACSAAAEELRQISRLSARWLVEQAPASLRAPQIPPRTASRWPLTRRQWLLGACAGAAAVIGWVLVSPPELPKAARPMEAFVEDRSSSSGERLAQTARSEQPAPPASSAAEQPLRQPLVTRTASLRVVAGDFEQVRAAIERITGNARGFVEELNATSTPPSGRAVHAVLRIPATNLSAALVELRTLGQVVDESQASADVTDQIVDLETRLANARMTERRLVAVLQKSGAVADVLEVEREISRVRGEIERLDAERTNVGRRVAYATITLDVLEERRADVAPRPSLGARLRDAVADGISNAVHTLVEVAVLSLRVGPTAMLWLIVGWTLWTLARRVRKMRGPARTIS
jgi:hypothetical protein